MALRHRSQASGARVVDYVRMQILLSTPVETPGLPRISSDLRSSLASLLAIRNSKIAISSSISTHLAACPACRLTDWILDIVRPDRIIFAAIAESFRNRIHPTRIGNHDPSISRAQLPSFLACSLSASYGHSARLSPTEVIDSTSYHLYPNPASGSRSPQLSALSGTPTLIRI